MIKSMTSYAAYEGVFEDAAISVEIRTYNGRFFDMVLKTEPYFYNIFEERIKKIVSEAIIRGRVQIKLKLEENSSETVEFTVDRRRVEGYYDACLDICRMLDIKEEIPPEVILRLPDIIKPAEPEKDYEKIFDAILYCIKEALEALDVMRKQEGSFIEKDLKIRIAFIKDNMDLIEAESYGLVEGYRKKLMTRLESVMIDTHEDRIAQEIALFADKSDISEEIVRVRSHLEQFENFMDSEVSEGRKLNFLIQEIHREVNTIGSKTTSFDVSSLVIEVKAELEKIREQVQNIE